MLFGKFTRLLETNALLEEMISKKRDLYEKEFAASVQYSTLFLNFLVYVKYLAFLSLRFTPT